MSSYLFIDGNYLQQRMTSAIAEFFPGTAWTYGPEHLARLRRSIECSKAFYYDCADESDAAKRAFIERVRDLEGFHAPLGTLKARQKGAKREPRQKEVDVQLAVDVMTHVFRGNAKEVVLITGDLDFNPLVGAVVEAGAWMTLLYDARSIDSDLRRSADLAMRMSLQNYLEWGGFLFGGDGDAIPRGNYHDSQPSDWQPLRWEADSTEGPWRIFQGGGYTTLYIPVESRDDRRNQLGRYNAFEHKDVDVLKRFAEHESGGSLQWREVPRP